MAYTYAGFIVAIALAVSAGPLQAADDAKTPDRPAKATIDAPKTEFPTTVDAAKAETDAKPDTWKPEQVAEARAQCKEILAQISAVAIPMEPLKDGDCGAPGPVQLISVGQNPQVTISPPATVTCKLAESLAQWVNDDLQPLARKHLGGPIIRIENMSSYVCRNVYGRKGGRLSEHALANALDIRGFVSTAATEARVLAHWGETQRQMKARVAAEKAARQREKEMLAKAEAEKKKNAPKQKTTGVSVTLPWLKDKEQTKATLSFSDPERLGGPPSLASEPMVEDAKSGSISITVKPGGRTLAAFADDPRSKFLRLAHGAACKIFGTTLGPELNKAHGNHFHVDMAPRRYGKICD